MPYQHFKDTVTSYYFQNARDGLPWRATGQDGHFDPYHIMVSEVMLQQTQVDRVVPKYLNFIKHFPDVDALAKAPLIEIMRVWQGLGYNRRAKYLQAAAQAIVERHNSQVPDNLEQLTKLPGIGVNTAGAILAYAYNKPVIFVETNIRTVYIHHFFSDQEQTSDKQIISFLELTIDKHSPREWYWALMDYGTYLKKSGRSHVQKSKHYIKQSQFKGSKREIRGLVIRALVAGAKSISELKNTIDDDRLTEVLAQLQKEGIITSNDNIYKVK